METVYPDGDEINFRKAECGAIENILNDKIECAICKSELMNEIVLKKMIMVHRIHLILCCYNCFYKLCNDNEFNCILCESDNELSNCEKCGFNVCKRCIEIHEIEKVSNNVLTKCFGCQPRMLWKQRAQMSNVLKVFSSQLNMPNGLLVNDVKREQPVRKYLIKKSKNGKNSKPEKIKEKLCLNFFLSSYKSTVEKITTFSPNDDVNIPIENNLNEFIQICENVVENTFSTLTSIKKTFDNNEPVPGHSKMSENSVNMKKKNTANPSPNMSNTRSLKSKKKLNLNRDSLKSSTSLSNPDVQQNTHQVDTDIKVVIKHSDDSILSEEMGNMSSNVNIDMEIDEIIRPLDLFDNNSRNKDKNTRKIRSHKIKKIDEKKQITHSEKSKNKKIANSDDVKKNSRPIKFNNIEKQSKDKTIIDENCSDTNGIIDIEISDTDKNDDSSTIDVVNECMMACNGRGIEYYRNKEQENQSDVDDLETIDLCDESESLEDSDTSDSSDNHDSTPLVTSSKRSHFKMSMASDGSKSDSQSEKKLHGTKRKLIISTLSKNSFSSANYLKKTQKRN